MKLYNTMTRQKEEFVPLQPGQVKMYVCGPTVYDFLHVGNFRGPVVFNLLRNWFEIQHGYDVTYALNFTDVDDRIITKASKEGVSSEEISERYIAEYKKDFKSLGLKRHEINPKVTESIDEIKTVISKLIDNKKAYISGQDVLYAVESFEGYGKLSGRQTDELLSGVRKEVHEGKKNPLDFALWKSAKANETGWDSDWGSGRPGWHIECSAMISKHFGEQIDIHGGGLDLLFPHHENEIAQSEGCTGKKFVNYWMHVNMLNFSGQKMSKSVGNIVSLREFISDYPAEVYKWMILSVHYRSTCEFSLEAVDRAISSLARVYSALALAESQGGYPETSMAPMAVTKLDADFSKAWESFATSLDDDLNTPEAFAALFEIIRLYNSQVRRGSAPNPQTKDLSVKFVQMVQQMGLPMSLFNERPTEFLIRLDDLLLKKMNLQRTDVDQLVQERALARAAKDFKKSDELRDRLVKMGISVSDLAEGSFWEVAK